MSTHPHESASFSETDNGTLVPPAGQRRRETEAEAEAAGKRALRQRSKEWDAEHQARAAEHEKNLRADVPDAGRDEVLVYQLAGAETALVERTERTILQLLERADLLVDQPTHILKITKALRELVAVRGALGGRVESLLGTASVLRAQRRLQRTAQKSPDLRVA